ncbi:membrane associated rhomboid family serine protease [Aeromicrobium panaciterrae]|uniref:Membrane associated rhomboid family serine protease n=1 Tax=Aeromicrobium panaciterrae TaxID=363861 RepID=A0ABU1UJZ9_9ACTN|nr:rhomboid family intramembrane serine protease [Aeromicrobium panaciterrae]MDR7085495.1 membrane associated rhomboid family serine protease [Aeromicrobium panaciterrae]
MTEGAKTIRAPRTIAGGAVSAYDGLVSKILIGLNVVVYILQLATDDRAGSVCQHGAMQSYAVADGDYWRLLTAAFLHGSLLHIAFNMYALYLFGPFAEKALGTVRFIAAYITMAIASSVFVYWLETPQIPTIGASGAVFGVFGLVLLLLLKAKQDVTTLLVLLAINAVISLQGNISWQGHLGGFVAGCILGAAFAYAPRERKQAVQVLVFAGVWIAMIAAIVIRTGQLS